MRLFLVLWLALFAVQTSDLLAAVSPDECAESDAGAADDACPDDCARCVCCARAAVFVAHAVPPLAGVPVAPLPIVAPGDRPSSADPHGILHVPKTR
jgi:hypothetical protein